MALLAQAAADTGAVVILSEQTQVVNLSATASLFRDSSGTVSFDEIATAAYAGRFEKSKTDWPNFGFTEDAVWLRLELQSASLEPALFFAALHSTRIEEVDWYLRRGGEVSHAVSGFGVNRSEDSGGFRYPVLPVLLLPDESATLYVRVRSRASLNTPLWIYGADAFASQAAREEMWYMFFFGCLAVLLALALIFALVSRIPGYFTYALCVGSMFLIFWNVTGYWRWLGWPFGMWIALEGNALLIQFTIMALIQYMRDFFQLRSLMPRYDFALRCYLICGVGLLALTQLLPFPVILPFLYLEIVLVGFMLLFTAILMAVKRVKTARFYLMAWGQFWLFLLYQIGVHFALLPYVVQPLHFTLLGLTLGYTLFFVAMADKMRELRLEKERLTLDARANFLRYVELITRDLHDGVAGALTNISMIAMNARHKQEEPEVRDDVLRIERMAVDANSDLRNVMNSMESGTSRWSDWYNETVRRMRMALEGSGIAFDAQLQGTVKPDTLPLSCAMSLQRMVKEMVANVIRHSNASTLTMRVRFEKGRMILSADDDGVGLPDDFEQRGRGITNIKRRVTELGGRIQLTGGGGTSIVVTIPVPLPEVADTMPT